MIPWTSTPSPDGIKASSWRVRLLVRINPLTGSSHSSFFHGILDTGALWTTFTEDFARAARIADITSGVATTVRWFSIDHDAWQHRVRLAVAINPSASDTVSPEPIDVLFIKRFPHPVTNRKVSLAVLGMDCASSLRMTLDGPSTVTRF